MIPRSVLIAFGAFAVVIVLGLFTIVAVQQYSPFHDVKVGGPFTMTEMTGRPVSEKDLLGKPAAVFFGFTSCPQICPTTLSALSDVLKRMGRNAGKLNVVFVTLDPQRDTPEQMRSYLSSFDPRIRGFTGTESQVAAMANAFHVLYRRVPIPGGYTLDHSAAVSLFDTDGRIVGEIPYDESEDKALAKLATLVQPDVCVPGAPPRVDLWSGATLGSACGAT